MDEIIYILNKKLPIEIVLKICFKHHGLQHPISKILKKSCHHIDEYDGNHYKKICNCDDRILLDLKASINLKSKSNLHWCNFLQYAQAPRKITKSEKNNPNIITSVRKIQGIGSGWHPLFPKYPKLRYCF